ncbi:GTPase SAR1 family protein [Siphonobacter sp. SORGH_AS 1065]|nr:GTPase SAR1 family protein [Siphonobacter sp. SORGH_AS_1065]
MNIYVIAGPPGVGKSSNAVNFIPEYVPIVDQDLAGYQYKNRDFLITKTWLRSVPIRKLEIIFSLEKILPWS